MSTPHAPIDLAAQVNAITKAINESGLVEMLADFYRDGLPAWRQINGNSWDMKMADTLGWSDLHASAMTLASALLDATDSGGLDLLESGFLSTADRAKRAKAAARRLGLTPPPTQSFADLIARLDDCKPFPSYPPTAREFLDSGAKPVDYADIDKLSETLYLDAPTMGTEATVKTEKFIASMFAEIESTSPEHSSIPEVVRPLTTARWAVELLEDDGLLHRWTALMPKVVLTGYLADVAACNASREPSLEVEV